MKWKIRKCFIRHSKEFQYIFSNCPKVKRILSSHPIVIYYVVNNNFFYTQLAFDFVPQKDSYYITPFFFSFFRKNLISFLFFVFCFFLLQKEFDITCFFLEFFFVFLIIVVCHFSIQKKIYKKYFFICFKS